MTIPASLAASPTEGAATPATHAKRPDAFPAYSPPPIEIAPIYVHADSAALLDASPNVDRTYCTLNIGQAVKVFLRDRAALAARLREIADLLDAAAVTA